MNPNPFAALGLPERPDLTDEQVRAAWRTIAAATHPDRRDGGDIARYTAAASAYAQLRTGWGRTEAYADVRAGACDTTPLPAADDPADDPANDTAPEMPLVLAGAPARVRRHLPGRIRHGRPLRLLTRGLTAALASLAVLHLIPGQPAAPALVTGLILWFVRTCPADLAPPPER